MNTRIIVDEHKCHRIGPQTMLKSLKIENAGAEPQEGAITV